MTQRKCPECNSELVQARRPENQSGSGAATGSSNYWRCSTCGCGFTAEQIRETKRPKVASKDSPSLTPPDQLLKLGQS